MKSTIYFLAFAAFVALSSSSAIPEPVKVASNLIEDVKVASNLIEDVDVASNPSDAVKFVENPIEDVEVAHPEGRAARANFVLGSYRNGDRLLLSRYVYRGPIANSIQYEDIVFRGATNSRIHYIRALEVGSTQWGQVTRRAGGINYNNVTLRFTSARGWGYYYLLEIWGQ